jgi:SAM-dependent methyltransferase
MNGGTQASSPSSLDSRRIVETEQVPCGICGSERSESYSDSFDYEYETCGNTWKFVRCLECGNIYLNPRPVGGELSTIYPENYYSYLYQNKVNPLLLWGKQTLDRLKFKSLLKAVGRWPITFLDIGCGDGRYLRLIESKGISRENLYGIEIEAKAAARLRDAGFQVEDRPFEDVDSYRDGQFDLIVMFSVLEHLRSPKEALEKCFRILKPGGVVAFEIPNPHSINARLFRRRYWGGYHTPRHWNLPPESSVHRIATELGFDYRKPKRTTGHAFWPWSLHHWVRYRLGWRWLGQLLSPHRCWPLVIAITLSDSILARLGVRTDNTIYVLKKPQ